MQSIFEPFRNNIMRDRFLPVIMDDVETLSTCMKEFSLYLNFSCAGSSPTTRQQTATLCLTRLTRQRSCVNSFSMCYTPRRESTRMLWSPTASTRKSHAILRTTTSVSSSTFQQHTTRNTARPSSRMQSNYIDVFYILRFFNNKKNNCVKND